VQVFPVVGVHALFARSEMLRDPQIERQFKNRDLFHGILLHYGQFLGSSSTCLQITCLTLRHKSEFQSQGRICAWNSL